MNSVRRTVCSPVGGDRIMFIALSCMITLSFLIVGSFSLSIALSFVIVYLAVQSLVVVMGYISFFYCYDLGDSE